MKEIKVINQKEFDTIKENFEGVIRIDGSLNRITARPKAKIYVSDNATVEYVSDNAIVEYVSGNAIVKLVYGNATVEYVSGNAIVKHVSGNAIVKSVSGNAIVKSVYGNAIVKSVSDNAIVKSVYGNATIQKMFGYAVVCLVMGQATINCFGYNTVRHFADQKDIKISKSKNTTIVVLPVFKPTLKSYKELYPVEEKDKKIILYKSVRKLNGKYVSDYNNDFEYKVGEIKEEKCDVKTEDSCSFGLHVSHKIWATNFGKSWDNQALLECEVDEKDIVVSKDCDGKVRCSKLKVVREIPKEEYFN